MKIISLVSSYRINGNTNRAVSLNNMTKCCATVIKRRTRMKKRKIFTLSTLAFSMGIVFGFLISPAKNGFGNNAGNTTNNYYDKKHLTTDESIDESQSSHIVEQW